MHFPYGPPIPRICKPEWPGCRYADAPSARIASLLAARAARVADWAAPAAPAAPAWLPPALPGAAAVEASWREAATAAVTGRCGARARCMRVCISCMGIT